MQITRDLVTHSFHFQVDDNDDENSNGSLKNNNINSVTVSSISSECLPNERSTLTDPDELGPCEPGTAVKLNGVVFQETDKGRKQNK